LGGTCVILWWQIYPSAMLLKAPLCHFPLGVAHDDGWWTLCCRWSFPPLFSLFYKKSTCLFFLFFVFQFQFLFFWFLIFVLDSFIKVLLFLNLVIQFQFIIHYFFQFDPDSFYFYFFFLALLLKFYWYSILSFNQSLYYIFFSI
jgi:hypothetical protein